MQVSDRDSHVFVCSSVRPSDLISLGSADKSADTTRLGETAHTAWAGFVEHVTVFAPRGGMRAAVTGPDVAWLAANIDIGAPPTPYRFFYILVREDDRWQIVVSHDAVSRACRRAVFGRGRVSTRI